MRHMPNHMCQSLKLHSVGMTVGAGEEAPFRPQVIRRLTPCGMREEGGGSSMCRMSLLPDEWHEGLYQGVLPMRVSKHLGVSPRRRRGVQWRIDRKWAET